LQRFQTKIFFTEFQVHSGNCPIHCTHRTRGFSTQQW
jgi:hypothetical protein